MDQGELTEKIIGCAMTVHLRRRALGIQAQDPHLPTQERETGWGYGIDRMNRMDRMNG